MASRTFNSTPVFKSRRFGRTLGFGLLVLLLAAGRAAAGDEELRLPFPGNEPAEKTLRDRERAQAFFAEENYRRSLFIYEKDLAVLGDKYAQYMVGVHHQHGLGVPVDLPRAYAWHRLAAERGNPKLMELRDALARSLSPAQMKRGTEIFVELHERRGDRALLSRLIRNDMALLRASVGSRVGAQGSPVTVVTRDGQNHIGATYYREIEERIEARLEYLSGRVEYGELQSIRDELDQLGQLRTDSDADAEQESALPEDQPIEAPQ